MTVTIADKKSVEPSKFVKALAEGEEKTMLQAQVDEFIMLRKTLMDLNAFELVKEYEKLKKVLQSIASAEGVDMTAPYTFNSKLGDVTFTAAKTGLEVTDKAKMIEVLGDAQFAAIANVSMTDLKKYCSLSELSQFTEKVTGSRSLGAIVVK